MELLDKLIVMDYLKMKKHILNKKSFFIYGIIIFLSFLLVYFVCINGIGKISPDVREIAIIIAILNFLFLSIQGIFINLYRCRNFYKFYENLLKESNPILGRIIIIKEDFKMQVPNKSYDTIVHPSPKFTNAVYIETDNFILLFFSIQCLGIFQKVLNPFIFIKTDKEFKVKDKHINIIKDFEIIENNQDTAIIFPNKYDIKRMIIPKS